VVQRRAQAAAALTKPQVEVVDPTLLATMAQENGEASFKPTALETEHVAHVYESIASHWDRTRHSPWPQVEQFLLALERSALVADVGCGNGKYMTVAREHSINMLGSDLCVNLVEVCGEKALEASIADNMVLPYRDQMFDAAISIAVLHHFATRARRIRALQEVCRILKPGGQLLVQAWALEQVHQVRCCRERPAATIM
jgi:ubiquinone/menaquinone biosynthesis C-methylase UbiE